MGQSIKHLMANSILTHLPLRAESRMSVAPGDWYYAIGFRVALDLP